MSLVSAITPTSDSAQLGRYTLLFRFAAGGMAEVFVGRMQGEGGFEKPVAIKRMLPALAEEPRFVDMFLDEARIAAMVTSPHVVPTLDVGKDDEGSPYIVMELVTGLSLSQLLRMLAEKKTIAPLSMIVDVLAQTAQGLDDAHAARRPSGESLGIIHRDVSPQNVLVGVDGRARLTDFGVARALERVTRTTTGEVKGKLSYFSPEQAKNLDLDQRSDVFALGVVAWESVTGHRLFQRDNPVMTLKAILEEPIPLITLYRKDAPDGLANAIALALARDREQRFQSAGAFAQALRSSGVPGLARRELGAWVEASGGDRLKQFQARIAQAFSGDPASRRRDPTPVPLAQQIAVEVEPVQSSTRARTTPAVASSPGVVEHASVPSASVPSASVSSEGTAQPADRRPWIVAGVAILIAAAFAVGFFALGGGPAPAPQASLAAPEVVPPPPAAVAPPPLTAPVAVVPTSPEPAPPEPVVVAPPEPVAPAAPVEHGSRVGPRPTVDRPPVASPPPVAATPTPAPEPAHETPVVHEPPPTRETPVAHETVPPAETPAPTPAPAGRRGRLLGLDQFQRETTTP